MKRTIKALVVSVLMVVLMATIVSPAFAEAGGNGVGYGPSGPHGHGVKDEDGNIGWCDPDRTQQELKWYCNSKAR
jgi:hypothetical protein